MDNTIKNHKMLAQFASISYKDSIHYEKNGWKHDYIKQTSIFDLTKSGFFGASFTNANSVIIVFRGTDNDISDWVFNNPCFVFECKPTQYDVAYKFAKYIIEELHPTKDIVITGHSLGGALAQLVGIAFSLPVVSFDSPGTLGIAEYMFNSHQVESNKITAYVSTPNGANIVGRHITELMQIIETPTLEAKKGFPSFLSYTLHFHSIEKIAESFNDNGTPKFRIQHHPENWSGLSDIYTQFYKNMGEFQGCYYAMNDNIMHFKSPPLSLALSTNKETQIAIKVTKYFAFQAQDSICFKNHKGRFDQMLKVMQGKERDTFDIMKNIEGESVKFNTPIGCMQNFEFGLSSTLLPSDINLATYTISTLYTFPKRKHCSDELYRDAYDAKEFICQFKGIISQDYNCENDDGIPLQCNNKAYHLQEDL